MNVKATAIRCVEIFCAIAIIAILYNMLIHTYFVLPRLDKRFLQSSPTKAQVLARFGKPAESVTKNERFEPTGWYPCPDKPADCEAHSFVRKYGDKLYIYFDASGRIEVFTRGKS